MRTVTKSLCVLAPYPKQLDLVVECATHREHEVNGPTGPWTPTGAETRPGAGQGRKPLSREIKMNQEKGKLLTLKARLMLVATIGIIYGWSAPKWLAPHRHDSSSFPLFIGLQVITMGTAIILTIGRRPRKIEIAALVLVVSVWIYLFFFVMLNSFGS